MLTSSACETWRPRHFAACADAHPERIRRRPAIVLTKWRDYDDGLRKQARERETARVSPRAFQPLIHMRDPAKLEGGYVMRVGRRLLPVCRVPTLGIAQLADELGFVRLRIIPVELTDACI